MRNHIGLIMIALYCGAFVSCKKEKSSTTGWNYNDEKWGSFEVAEAQPQETGPNLVYVAGGTFSMGQTEQDVTFEADAMPRKTTVSSFYMDETEVKNLDYREYLHWIGRVFIDYPQVYEQALPDTLVWRDPLAYNEPFVRYYFRHPAYQNYPVVGVSWVQAAKYCEWRTDRVNEYILIREKIIEKNPDQMNEENFNTEAYLSEQYDPVTKRPIKNPSGEERRVRMEDGILLPEYRLPTEAEWEYAALALPGNAVYENVNTRRMYPWNGYTHRMEEGKYKGKFRANFQRGAGDLQGVASDLNDQGAIPTPVVSYWPNEFGLYNMAGNVSE
ncbi:MAG: SUMF1/EgtB/PvdO family nonheme iron enzyme, partial [Bacteroidia bacterium]